MPMSPRFAVRREPAVQLSSAQTATRHRLVTPQLSEQALFPEGLPPVAAVHEGNPHTGGGPMAPGPSMDASFAPAIDTLRLPQPSASFFETLETIARATASSWREASDPVEPVRETSDTSIFQKDPPLAEDDEFALQLEFVSTDGGEYSRDYNCANMLRNDASCYSSTKQEGVNVVAQVVNAPHFTMAEMEAIAPCEGYTSPLGQCCVFVSWDYPDVASVADYDSVQSRSEFLKLAGRTQQRLPSTPVPVGFLDLAASFRAKEHLQLARSGCYVLIKLLRARNSGENVDVQYVGFRGLTAPHGEEQGALL